MKIRDWWIRTFRPESRRDVAAVNLPRRWLPVIDRDYCTGCGLCVRACARRCLDLVWDFATLARPEDCDGDGGCAAACPDGLIRMDWVPCPAPPVEPHAGRRPDPPTGAS